MTANNENQGGKIKARGRNIALYSQSASTAFQILMWIFLSLYGLFILGILIEGGFSARIFFQASIMFLLPGIVMYFQWNKREMNIRGAKYLKIINANDSYPLKKLAAETGRNSRRLISDLKYMIDNGILPDASLDYEEGLIYFTDDIACSFKSENSEGNSDGQKDDKGSSPEKYIYMIKKANNDIQDKEVSESLKKLEKITEEIFTYISRHPDKISEVRKLIEYHLPMAIKLAGAFKEMSGLPINSKSIEDTKGEIKKALATINKAFENVLDNLCRDMVLDVSSDIAALNAILCQDGLLKNDDFNKSPKVKNK